MSIRVVESDPDVDREPVIDEATFVRLLSEPRQTPSHDWEQGLTCVR
jgi:hypothetical protein